MTTFSPQETQDVAAGLGRELSGGEILCLKGTLGTGKTTFVKGLARGMALAKATVSSPTFTLMNIYEGSIPLYHFDLYRFDDSAELAVIGYEEFLYGDGVAVIEWAEKMGPLMPRQYLDVSLNHSQGDAREITFSPRGDQYQKLLEKWKMTRSVDEKK